ncbi:MAG: cytochrome C [Campylobacteraceae bacterium 4484_166]|nr:MAG: cytochrome C [Campylobacteraceae bacterium 4484_166]
MHPHVDAPDYQFKDIKGLDGQTGDATNGATLVQANCIACHSIKSANFPPLMDNATSAASYGVVPPDLGSSGLIYDEKYLAAFIQDPATATNTKHKFVDGAVHPMPSYSWMPPQDIADMVAYLKSIAPKKLSNKEVFADACQRCHSMKYGDFYGGSMKAFSDVSKYMGSSAPDLSQLIRSRNKEYLHEFINNPQKHLKGTAMPRVGLTKAAEEQVIAYMENVGDSKKPQRDSLAWPFLAYLLVFAIFAWAWKIKIWKEVH